MLAATSYVRRSTPCRSPYVRAEPFGVRLCCSKTWRHFSTNPITRRVRSTGPRVTCSPLNDRPSSRFVDLTPCRRVLTAREESTESNSRLEFAPSSSGIWDTHTEHVNVGGSGTVPLEIYRLKPDPSVIDDAKGHARNGVNLEDAILRKVDNDEILVFLPSGGLFDSGPVDEVLCFSKVLSAVASACRLSPNVKAVVTVNYRLGQAAGDGDVHMDHRFPRPIHDVASCFDWIVQNKRSILVPQVSGAQDQNSIPGEDGSLLSSSSNALRTSSLLGHQDITREREVTTYGPDITVCGRHVGGALALGLALTMPNAIASVAVKDPIVDWVGLDELGLELQGEENGAVGHDDDSNISKRKAKSRPAQDLLQAQRLAAACLIDLRTKLFRTVSAFFDPFASPMMFLRAPGKDTPRWKTARPERGEVSVAAPEDFGPYDDDMHAAAANYGLQNMLSSEDKIDLIVEGAGADAYSATEPDGAMLIDEYSTSMPLSNSANDEYLKELQQGLSDLSLTSTVDHMLLSSEHRPIKRRKVLRRWPPVGRPEDVLLPYTTIYSTPPRLTPDEMEDVKTDRPKKPDLQAVLHPHAKEMTDLMQRACFWGREKTLAMERVSLQVLHDSPNFERRGDAEFDRHGGFPTRQALLPMQRAIRTVFLGHNDCS